MLYSGACGYAIRALTHLAEQHGEEFCQLREIALTAGIPAAFLGKILPDLVRAGLLRSSKGPRGGYALAGRPAAITLLAIMEVVDGTAELERCASGLGACSDDTPCPQHERFKPLRQSIRRYLATTTVADMARALAEKRALLAGARTRQRRRPKPASHPS